MILCYKITLEKNLGFMSYYSLQKAIYTKIHYLTHDSMEFNQRGKHFSGYEIKLGNYYRA